MSYSSASSILSESTTHSPQQSTMSLAFRKFTRSSGKEDQSFKIERERIKTEIKLMRKQLKQRKFELLANNIWYSYLLLYLCRSEQFILSSTCKYCLKKCGMIQYNFSQQFEFDNIYWRQNFFNFISTEKDSTLLINKNKFELLSMTQKRQLKYYIKFWDKFICEKENRKKIKQIEEKMDAICVPNSIENKAENIELESVKSVESAENNNKKSDSAEELCDEEKEKEDDDLFDLLDGDFEYDSSDDRPRGIQLLDRYRIDCNVSKTENTENALLKIAIPTDIEQLIIYFLIILLL